MSSFTSQEQNIGQLFTISGIYTIPNYQRSYKWEDEHIDRFFNDIKNAYLTKDSIYFIGSVIILNNKEKSTIDILDGQQRMTTIFLLLKALRCCLDNHKSQIDSILYDFLQKDVKIKLEPKRNLQSLPSGCSNFTDFIKLEDDKISSLKSSKKNRYTSNYLTLVEYIKTMKNEGVDLSEFFKYFVYNVHVVKIECSDIVNAIKIFDTINSAGLNLSTSDMIKSKIMHQCSNDDFSNDDLNGVDNSWSDIENVASEIITSRGNKMDIMLNNFFLYKYGIYDKGLLEKFETNKNEFKMKDFVEFVEVCEKITKEECRFISSLHILKWDTSWLPLLANKKSKINTKDYLVLKKDIVKLCYSYFLAGKRSDSLIPVVSKIINDEKKIQDLITENYLKEIEALVAMQDIYTDASYKAKCRAIFHLLETFYADNTYIIESQTSLDHILPKSKNLEFQYVHSIGNLALMSKSKNSAFGNKETVQAKSISYQNSAFRYIASSFDKDFGVENITQRAEKIKDDLIKIFQSES